MLSSNDSGKTRKKAVYVIMGVCGCGKTTVGRALAKRLGLRFFDGDEFHPSRNVAKMSAGEALTDADRWPWLDILAGKISEWGAASGAVLACSALKKSYRDRLRSDRSEKVVFIFLTGSRALLEQRLVQRSDHYMDPGLLDSQLATLEEPGDAIQVSIDAQPEAIADAIVDQISEQSD